MAVAFRQPPRAAAVSAAFSLLEMVLVVGIVATLSAIALPRYTGALLRHRLETAARRIAADFALARHQAERSGVDQQMLFDVSGDTYELPGIGHLNDPTVDYSVDLREAPYRARLVSADFGGSQAVTFDGYGVPDSGGTIVVAVGASEMTVKVIAADGHVIVD